MTLTRLEILAIVIPFMTILLITFLQIWISQREKKRETEQKFTVLKRRTQIYRIITIAACCSMLAIVVFGITTFCTLNSKEDVQRPGVQHVHFAPAPQQVEQAQPKISSPIITPIRTEYADF
jgi:uncharacterized membrane protein